MCVIQISYIPDFVPKHIHMHLSKCVSYARGAACSSCSLQVEFFLVFKCVSCVYLFSWFFLSCWRLVSGHRCLHSMLWAAYGIYSASLGEVTESIGKHYHCIAVLCIFIFVLLNKFDCFAGWQDTDSSSFYENSYSSTWCFPSFGTLILVLIHA